MKFCVLMGSPNFEGNTWELVKPFLAELEEEGQEVDYITLADKYIAPCDGCYACQDVQGKYGCVKEDDGTEIMERIIRADYIVLATPIYSWYCTAPMKALLDRHFGLNKFYRSAKGSLLEGKGLALITTHGYPREYGAGVFEEGMRRFCEHSKLKYMGMYSVRDVNGISSFKTREAVDGVKAFARGMMGR